MLSTDRLLLVWLMLELKRVEINITVLSPTKMIIYLEILIIIFVGDRTVIFISTLFSSNINHTRSSLSVLSIKSTSNYLNIFNSISRKLETHSGTSQRILHRDSIQQVSIFIRSATSNMNFIIGDNNNRLLVKNIGYIIKFSGFYILFRDSTLALRFFNIKHRFFTNDNNIFIHR